MKSILSPVATLVASLSLVAGASAAAAAPLDAANSQTVTIDNFAFAPADLAAPAGMTLTWTNLQNVRHTSTADNGLWDSDVLTNGQLVRGHPQHGW
jgi:plastocyanin